MEKIDIVGKRFGKLLVIKLHSKVKKNNKIGLSAGNIFYYECKCDCGNICIVNKYDLTRKNSRTNSCGCLRRELQHLRDFKHGMGNTRHYRIWSGFKSRCYNKNDKDYHNYGERGIKVYDEWLDKEYGFINFYNWATNNGYNNNLTIDRIDVNGDYEPSNCRWANNEQQANNRRDNLYYEYNGKIRTLTEICRELGLKYTTIRYRLLFLGMNIEDAVKKQHRDLEYFEYNGDYYNIYSLCRKLNVNYLSVRRRMKNNINYIDAINDVKSKNIEFKEYR